MKNTILHLGLRMAVPAACAALVTGLFAACSTDDPVAPSDNRVPLSIAVTIGGASTRPATRAVRDDEKDLWSYVDFADEDQIGLFAEKGFGTNGSTGAENFCLELSDGMFQGTETVDNEKLAGGKARIYFPYAADIQGSGLELRSNQEPPGRCLDFLLNEGSKVNLTEETKQLATSLIHAFAELIIMPGEGFKNATDRTIAVVMKDPVTHVKLNYKASPWSCEPELVYDPAATTYCDQGDARRWVAWKGANYGRTVDESTGEQLSEGVEAWYVIVPTIKGKPSEIEYIELFDDEGKPQRVTTLHLDISDDSDPDRTHGDRDGSYVWSGSRYPMQIDMEELVPTVHPFPILPWEGDEEGHDKDITNSRPAGIANLTEFKQWLGAYNRYLESNRTLGEDDLFQYGDKEIEGDQAVWHFYISSGIDFSQAQSTNGSIIPQLEDILDGIDKTVGDNLTLTMFQLSGLGSTFVGKLSGNGCLQNIDFRSPTVQTEATAPTGILVGTIAGGSVINCNINNGSLIGGQATPVGILAGSITGGTVEQCTCSGLLIGGSTDATSGYLFGVAPSNNSTIQNNNSTNVIFTKIN